MKNYLSFLIALAVTFSLMPFFKWLAFKLRIVDLPGERKIHKATTPLLGGLAVYTGAVVALLFNLRDFTAFVPIAVCSTIILLVGLLDDIRGLSARLRLASQIVVALIMIQCGERISFMPNNWWGDSIEVIVTVLWIVGLTNAYNYLDGMNGLAGGSAAINLFCFIVILYTSNQHMLLTLAIILLGALLGFLPYNFRKEQAGIFLGDSGSTFLGFTLASIALMGDWAADHIVKISIPVLILGVPIFDMIFTTIMRIRDEKITNFVEWLEYGGKDHFHHYLVDLGLMPFGAVLFIYGITLSLGLNAIMVSNDKAIEAFLSLAQAGIIFAIIAVLIVVGKRRRSGWRRE